jgi:hypothetical protein
MYRITCVRTDRYDLASRVEIVRKDIDGARKAMVELLAPMHRKCTIHRRERKRWVKVLEQES